MLAAKCFGKWCTIGWNPGSAPQQLQQNSEKTKANYLSDCYRIHNSLESDYDQHEDLQL